MTNGKSLRITAVLSLFVALSIIFGKYLSFTLGAIRISFENLPLLLAGFLFGPLAGAVVGVVSDLLGCLLVGYTINPIITLGAAAIGAVAGIFYKKSVCETKLFVLYFRVMTAHFVGSVVIKSIGLGVYYGYGLSQLLIRLPLYIVIGFLECNIIFLLFKNRGFCKMCDRLGIQTKNED